MEKKASGKKSVTKYIGRAIGSLTRPLGTIDIREDYVAAGLPDWPLKYYRSYHRF